MMRPTKAHDYRTHRAAGLDVDGAILACELRLGLSCRCGFCKF